MEAGGVDGTGVDRAIVVLRHGERGREGVCVCVCVWVESGVRKVEGVLGILTVGFDIFGDVVVGVVVFVVVVVVVVMMVLESEFNSWRISSGS